METLIADRRIIRDLISKYAKERPSVGEVEVEVVFDEANDHYELINNGWVGHQRIHGPLIHIDIRGGKVWIQHDGIEDGIAEELVEAGIPRDRIVLAFKHPSRRPLTDYATS